MPIYYSIDGRKDSDKRIAKGLLKLKDAFKKLEMPQRNMDDTLMLATWNIREFDSTKYGVRGKEPIFYIAEIINAFDIVAVQEVRDDLKALTTLMRYLGAWWKCVLTDVTEGSQGNRERMAFLYDSRKLNFGGLATNIVIPPVKKKGEELKPSKQLARAPFMVGFRAGWFKFTLCTTHILYGKAVAEDPNRVDEIKVLAEYLAGQARKPYAWAKNMILLGDFNIFDTSDTTMKAITKAGFTVPESLQKLPSNVPQNKHYDQIAFIAPDVQDHLGLGKAGVFNFFEHVYRKDEQSVYAEDMGKAYLQAKDGSERDEKGRTRYYNDWRTFQMSDHLPMWIELKINFGREYLNRKVRHETKPDAPPIPPA
ncbi:MAG TPA: endonuclease/exonuclease/phosphatase family protein [Blastocatellia bacterium]|nr:endonuclease/exonuclease/phosphatase family protein [Blastocatellia bacterium]